MRPAPPISTLFPYTTLFRSLVVELQTRAHLDLAVVGALRELLAVFRRVVLPQRIGRRRGTRVRPAEPHEAASQVSRRVLVAHADLPLVARRVGTPRGVGSRLGDRVLFLLIAGRRGERLRRLPLVLGRSEGRRGGQVG